MCWGGGGGGSNNVFHREPYGPPSRSNWIGPIAIRESPPQFENRIMARVYVRSIMRSTMYQKAPFCRRKWRSDN